MIESLDNNKLDLTVNESDQKHGLRVGFQYEVQFLDINVELKQADSFLIFSKLVFDVSAILSCC